MAGSSITPQIKVLFENVDDLLSDLEHIPEVSAGVGVVGDAASYALVWEWGSARITKPGPRTVWGSNPDGSEVVMSSQAPFGYLWVNEPYFWAIVRDEMLEFDPNRSDSIVDQLTDVARRAVTQIAPSIADFVPYDSGLLSESIVALMPGDPLLNESDNSPDTELMAEDL